jgi:hypothetical protein
VSCRLENYQIKISNRFAVLKNLNDSMNANGAWENLKENISISAKDSIKHGLMKNVYDFWVRGSSLKCSGYRTQTTGMQIIQIMLR